ncbi:MULTISPECIES: TadE/TadG family type IV pilus assembly protein [unclassified Mesorhizobium]|uniref:TadE/TadG family type IV pilus assembly protein n=1 Tax=unclassified Mesorhizobium TaxID=325217 RepID=UPI000F75B021|nr:MULTISPECIES: TadE/TadG family type IV pilus assembly protein [unclassified Mesorhizobium]AZO69356.1 pilus assembly protein [Mesorhizobium sp. M6A.T.Cr.TU.016.01.1.1]RUV03317.1 pilus assembly protein [Mesorhizobium sp. M6A.T.Cr.TU.017.01.1.1]RWN66090.1 MAG: pilus assembly protein [Mesorhizobium sp.]RWO99310.1 MAG: pilus assembly protein [Mesorhizobium sp.]RWP49681.1 MAG: pilus assembly protein [Mesorhizobium sp.]
MGRAGAHMGITGICTKAIRFCCDRRGVAAVEFAFIVPVLLIMYFMTMEASQAIETSKKVSRIGSMVADLVTQQEIISAADLDAIMKIGNSTLQPYNRSTPKIVITAIKVTNETPPKVQVVWSRKMVGDAFSADAAKDSVTTIPKTLEIKDTFLIRVESDLAYEPIITWSADSEKRLGLSSAFNKISMGETYYLRPRRSLTIPCATC